MLDLAEPVDAELSTLLRDREGERDDVEHDIVVAQKVLAAAAHGEDVVAQLDDWVGESQKAQRDAMMASADVSVSALGFAVSDALKVNAQARVDSDRITSALADVRRDIDKYQDVVEKYPELASKSAALERTLEDAVVAYRKTDSFLDVASPLRDFLEAVKDVCHVIATVQDARDEHELLAFAAELRRGSTELLEGSVAELMLDSLQRAGSAGIVTGGDCGTPLCARLQRRHRPLWDCVVSRQRVA